MRLNQIRDLLAIVEAGSVRAAARHIGVSQPALSKSLGQLERELETQLLLRTARGVVPTAAGRAVIARARVIQTELRRTQEDLAALRGSLDGTVAFGVGPAAIAPLVPNAMVRFRRKWPQAHVRIREGPRTALLPLVRDGTLDFTISEEVTPGEAGLKFAPLIRPEFVVAARRGHPLARSTSIKSLAQASWLIFYPLGQGGALERTFTAYGLNPPKGLVHCESYATALALVAGSDLLFLVVRQLLDEPLADRFLQRLPLREKIARPNIGMYTRIDAPLSPTAAGMSQALVAAARGISRTL